MATPADTFAKPTKLIGPVGILVDLLITAAFFVFMIWICYGHNLDAPPAWKWGLAAYTSACITGVFWLILQGFHIALATHLRDKKSGQSPS